MKHLLDVHLKSKENKQKLQTRIKAKKVRLKIITNFSGLIQFTMRLE